MGKRNKGKKKKAQPQSKGGSMTGLRSGFKSAVGQKKKKKKKRAKSSVSMVNVLIGGFGLSLIMVIIWQLAK